MQTLLEVENLTVYYGFICAISNVSFKVPYKKIVTLLGSNGAGKSTLLKTISGLLFPVEGKILYENRDITFIPPYERVDIGISLVPEGRRLFPNMTVLENLYLGAYTKKAREKLKDTLEWIFQMFPILKERKNQLAGTLSGGEAQMLAIARGLMSRPKLLMLDEPSLGLAPMIVTSIFKLIEDINQQEKIPILLVEQNAYNALKISDYTYVLENGRIVLEGESHELLENEMIKQAYLGI